MINEIISDQLTITCICHFTAGDLLGAMSNAVEKAEAVLVCVSKEYKESPNCRQGKDNASNNIYIK